MRRCDLAVVGQGELDRVVEREWVLGGEGNGRGGRDGEKYCESEQSARQRHLAPPGGRAVLSLIAEKEKGPNRVSDSGLGSLVQGGYIPGSDLLSHKATLAVPSAVEGLTSVFGMGTGVTPLLWPPGNCLRALRLGAKHTSVHVVGRNLVVQRWLNEISDKLNTLQTVVLRTQRTCGEIWSSLTAD